MMSTDAMRACDNTDRELWREHPGDFYSNSIHVTAQGTVGINVGGHVIVQSLEKWHAAALAQLTERDQYAAELRRLQEVVDTLRSSGDAVRAAIAQPVSAEPVAFADKIAFESAMRAGKGCDVWPAAGDYTQRTGRELVPLYAGPPTSAERVPLTDEQLTDIWNASLLKSQSVYAFARAIERAHDIGVPKC